MSTEKQSVSEARSHLLGRNHKTNRSDEIFEALQTIVSDVDTYLSNWCRRLDECAEPKEAAINPDAPLQQRSSKFQNEKMRWERQRKLEQQHLQEQANQLAEAWLRLEDEQRKFLQKNSQRQQGSERESTMATNSNVDQDTPSTDDGSSTCTDSSPSHDPSPTDQVAANPNPSARESAIRQFQQLQREIQSSRPNVKRRQELNCLSSRERR